MVMDVYIALRVNQILFPFVWPLLFPLWAIITYSFILFFLIFVPLISIIGIFSSFFNLFFSHFYKYLFKNILFFFGPFILSSKYFGMAGSPCDGTTFLGRPKVRGTRGRQRSSRRVAFTLRHWRYVDNARSLQMSYSLDNSPSAQNKLVTNF